MERYYKVNVTTTRGYDTPVAFDLIRREGTTPLLQLQVASATIVLDLHAALEFRQLLAEAIVAAQRDD